MKEINEIKRRELAAVFSELYSDRRVATVPVTVSGDLSSTRICSNDEGSH